MNYKHFLDPSHEFWSSHFSNTSITFIDIIKGIVPSKLYRIINDFADLFTTEKILSSFYDFVFDQSFELIWKTRCALTIAKELSLNITIAKKHQKTSQLTPPTNHSLLPTTNSLPLNHFDLSFQSLIHGRSVPFFLTQ